MGEIRCILHAMKCLSSWYLANSDFVVGQTSLTSEYSNLSLLKGESNGSLFIGQWKWI